MKDFRKINFGYMDAVQEGQERPDLLIKGYVDNDKIVEKALDKTTFLFLGYKGSGKSSLSEHLRLNSDEDTIVSQEGLKDFPYKTFNKIVAGDAEKEIKARNAWRWLLSIKVLGKLIEDPDAHADDEVEIRNFVEVFSQAGLFPISDMSALVRKTSSKTFKITIKAFSLKQCDNQENAEVSIDMSTELVLKLLKSYKESHRHIIVIDDLDDNITNREDRFISIAALINEVKTLNNFMIKENIPVKIITLCRTDIFDRLPDANKNKIRRDNSFTLSWYKEGVNTPSDSPLIQLVNKRARLVYPDLRDVLSYFFPSKYDGYGIYNYLLDFTRHTPRDFIQLMNCIRDQCQGNRVSMSAIDKGIKEYSLEYFVTEIQDEMAGYIDYDKTKLILGVFAIMRKREFSFQEFHRNYSNVKELRDTDVSEVMRVLYDCSAIGQIYSINGQDMMHTFKYRNRNSAFSEKDTILLHRGLWKALNVNY